MRATGWLVAVLATFVAFGVGYGWQYMRAAALQKQLTAVRAELNEQRLYVELGLTAFEAQRGNYEAARRQASRFFSALQGAMDAIPVDKRGPFAAILTQRDNVITGLSRGNAEAADVLSGLFAGIRDGAPPAPAAPVAGAAPLATQRSREQPVTTR